MRQQGILMPIASIPSAYGIGTFGKESYRFVDFLQEAGQTLWQILPLGPTSYGDSPYQSFSTFAGNPYFIDLEMLVADGLLTQKECDACNFGEDKYSIDYEKVYFARFPLLRKAFERGFEEIRETEKYKSFEETHSFWLEDYALYMAVKDSFGGVCFIEWDEDIRLRKKAAVTKYKKQLKEEIEFYKFQQYLFFEQWRNPTRMERELRLWEISPSMWRSTARILGQSRSYSRWIRTVILRLWRGVRRIISRRRGSFGEIRCITGVIIRRRDMPGGCSGLRTAMSCMTWSGLTISAALMSIGQFPLGSLRR